MERSKLMKRAFRTLKFLEYFDLAILDLRAEFDNLGIDTLINTECLLGAISACNKTLKKFSFICLNRCQLSIV